MTAELKIRNGKLELKKNQKISWSIEIKSIELVGEYTTEEGSFVDDYFFVFVNSDGTMNEVSNDFANEPTFWKQLSNELNQNVQPELANSTKFNSRILYPEHLTGEQLFNSTTFEIGKLELSERATVQLKNGL